MAEFDDNILPSGPKDAISTTQPTSLGTTTEDPGVTKLSPVSVSGQKIDSSTFKRAMLYPKPGGADTILGTNTTGVLGPIIETNKKLIFPYRPTLSYGVTVNYENYHFTHTNYKYNAWNNTTPNAITIQAPFTAQTPNEARYLLAVLHFFRVVTKGYFGENAVNNSKSGVPPPVLLFTYLGDYMFSEVPVIVSGFETTLPADVDYVEVPGFPLTNVPTSITLGITLDVQYNTQNLRKNFSLDDFTSGQFVSDDKQRGFI